eukprot:2172228-Prymnesium_polylepis.1
MNTAQAWPVNIDADNAVIHAINTVLVPGEYGSDAQPDSTPVSAEAAAKAAWVARQDSGRSPTQARAAQATEEVPQPKRRPLPDPVTGRSGGGAPGGGPPMGGPPGGGPPPR